MVTQAGDTNQKRRVWPMARSDSDVVHFLIRGRVLAPGTGEFAPSNVEGDQGFVVG